MTLLGACHSRMRHAIALAIADRIVRSGWGSDGRLHARGACRQYDRDLYRPLMVGFVLVLGFTWNELDAAVKGVSSSLATIATIGD